MAHRPGWKTSEFWLTAGIAAASTYIALDHSQPQNVKIAAITGAVLKALYYTSQRSKLKIDPPEGLREVPPGVVAK